MDQKFVTSVLTADELRKISDLTMARVRHLWSEDKLGKGLALTYCTRCPGGIRHKLKQYCVCYMETCEALCSCCFAKDLEERLIKTAIAEKKPKLDVEDFARIY